MGTQSAAGMTDEQYEQKWKSHIADLSGLGWNLTQDERDELEEMQENLRSLAARAAQRRGNDD